MLKEEEKEDNNNNNNNNNNIEEFPFNKKEEGIEVNREIKEKS